MIQEQVAKMNKKIEDSIPCLKCRFFYKNRNDDFICTQHDFKKLKYEDYHMIDNDYKEIKMVWSFDCDDFDERLLF